MPRKLLWTLLAAIAVASPARAPAEEAPATSLASSPFPPPVIFKGDGDHHNMMDQLGIKKLRPGANPNDQSTFDEATANKYPLPDLLTMNDGTRVTTPPAVGEACRSEIKEDFEREVYGRIPPNVPKVTWEVTQVTPSTNDIPSVTRTLVGHVDNSAYPLISVDIRASLTVPANAAGPVPVMVEFAGFGFPRLGAPHPSPQQQIRAATRPAFTPAWHHLVHLQGAGVTQ